MFIYQHNNKDKPQNNESSKTSSWTQHLMFRRVFFPSANQKKNS